MEITQYQIILINLDPVLGSGIQKTRPCAVISPNEIKHDNQIGWIVLDQNEPMHILKLAM